MRIIDLTEDPYLVKQLDKTGTLLIDPQFDPF